MASGAQLQLSPISPATGVHVGTEALTLNGTGTLPASDGVLRSASGTNSWAGPITLASDSRIGVESGSSLTLEGTEGPVAVLDVEGFPIIRHWYIAHTKGRELSLVARAFLEFVLDSRPRMGERMAALCPMLRDYVSGDAEKGAQQVKRQVRRKS